ncbi:hypothetical protein HYH03_009243 [Edaphochlamys debaryana]|uniref:Uncharacterized protein n=1 Tax=Edaphochlamys debaryana TaxID=47281 RepID=A0A836BY36_9CHLO|nr:hypothetical protein HYH03_009243 [Edaphochlamys debaryana]|eukprot:KAG2492582.1 hypothetical protein HYH03_009243 [Edaphochlamys debaryana]
MSAPHAAAVAELLSGEPAVSSALLRLQAAALRPTSGIYASTVIDVAWTLWSEEWRSVILGVVATTLCKATPLPPSRHALFMLCFVRALLRSQPFHATSRLLVAVATGLEAGGGSGGGGGGGASGGGARPGSGGGVAGSRSGGGGASPSGSRRSGSSSGGGAGSSSGGGAGSSRGGGRGGAISGGGGTGSSGGGGSGDGFSGSGGGAGCNGGGVAGSSSSGGGAGPSEARLATSILAACIAIVTALAFVLGLAGSERAVVVEAMAALPTEAAAEHSACVDHFVRGLAESGILEHATRLTLILQARHPQELKGKESTLICMQELQQALERASGPARLIWAPPIPADASSFGRISPATAALLRSALSGRCVQTAVLVYGVGTLRVADRGPSYSLPTELQTAGLTLTEAEDGVRRLDPIALELLLRQLASGGALLPPGPGASLELALRVGRAALGTMAASLPPQFRDHDLVRSPPLATLLKASVPAVRLAVGALACGRLLLPRQRPSPRLEAQLAGWWQLAVRPAIFSGNQPEAFLRHLWGMVTEPLLAMWPDGRLDLDALPLAAPPEVAAALGGKLLEMLAFHFYDESNPVAPVLFTTCEGGRPEGPGFALFLTPLLAYGDPGQCQKVLTALSTTAGSLLQPLPGGLGAPGAQGRSGAAGSATVRGPSTDTGPYQRASEAFFREAAAAIRRSKILAGADEAPAGGSGSAAAAGLGSAAAAHRSGSAGRGAAGSSTTAAPPPHLAQFTRIGASAAASASTSGASASAAASSAASRASAAAFAELAVKLVRLVTEPTTAAAGSGAATSAPAARRPPVRFLRTVLASPPPPPPLLPSPLRPTPPSPYMPASAAALVAARREAWGLSPASLVDSKGSRHGPR